MPSQFDIKKLGVNADQKYANKVGDNQFGKGNYKTYKKDGRWYVKQTQLRDPAAATPQTKGNLAGTAGYRPIESQAAGLPDYVPQEYNQTQLQMNPQMMVEGPAAHGVTAAPETTGMNTALPAWAQNSVNMIHAQGANHMQDVYNHVLPGLSNTMNNLGQFHQGAQNQLMGLYAQGGQAAVAGAQAAAPGGYGNIGAGGQAVSTGAGALLGNASVGMQMGAYQNAMGQLQQNTVAQAVTKGAYDKAMGIPAEYTKMAMDKEIELRALTDQMQQWRDQLDAQKWQAQEGMELDVWSQTEQMKQAANMFNSSQAWERDQFSNTFRQNENQFGAQLNQADRHFGADYNFNKAQFGDQFAWDQNRFHNEMAFNRQESGREQFNIDRDYIYGKKQDSITNAINMFNAQAGLATSMGQLGLSAAELANQQNQIAIAGATPAPPGYSRDPATGELVPQPEPAYDPKSPQALIDQGYTQVPEKPGQKHINSGAAVQGTDGNWYLKRGIKGGGGSGSGSGSGSDYDPPATAPTKAGAPRIREWWQKNVLDADEGVPPGQAAASLAEYIGTQLRGNYAHGDGRVKHEALEQHLKSQIGGPASSIAARWTAISQALRANYWVNRNGKWYWK